MALPFRRYPAFDYCKAFGGEKEEAAKTAPSGNSIQIPI
jgi:hypothetical protein